MSSLNRTIVRSVALAGLLVFAGAAARAAGAADTKARKQTFELVWSRVKEAHWDPTLGGVDWEAVKKKYQPTALNASSEGEFYGTLNRMLGELKQSHFGVIPPAGVDADDEEEPGNGGSGETGLTVQLVEGEAVVTLVEPGSGAERAGMRPGMALVKIAGKPVGAILTRVRKKAEALKLIPAEESLDVAMAIAGQLRGPEDSSVEVTYRDGEEQVRTVKVERREREGEVVRFGQLPPIRARVESRRLAGGVGYIRFNIFLLPLLETIRTAVREMKDAPGIIFDVRGNPGGIGMMAPAIARAFYDRQSNLGTMKMRTGELRFPVFPDEGAYKGPIVILTDEGSLSTSEIFAGGLQEDGRAVVVGRQTGGKVLPSQIEALPGGARLQYAVADFKTPKGVLLEGRGVTPDVPVTLTRKLLLAEGDPVLEQAMAVVRKKMAAD